MATTPPPSGHCRTHDVLNQPSPLLDYNPYEIDRPLVEGVRREGAQWAEQELTALGARVGSEEVIRWGFLANEHPPVLRTHDRFGHRIDEVEFHPAWHDLLALSVGAGLQGRPWREPRPAAHVARAAAYMLASQNEQGHACPVTMTYASVPVLQLQAELAAQWIPKVVSDRYDSRVIPAPQKNGVLIGMSMTEKQGGSDLRSNTTRAAAVGPAGPGEAYLVTGHKWFCSAPMCDAFLVLAIAPEGPSCFFLPRFTPDGRKNRLSLVRLKDKLGNRSNASSEIELDGAWATMVGEPGRGIRTIIEMANYSRLDCTLGSAALMRHAFVQAHHHARGRAAFGKLLVDQALMRNVLADLYLESEAATALALRLARAFDASRSDGAEHAFRRIATAISKYWVCKRAISHVAEALECLGGNGFVEESVMPRLYRESPVNSIWEGSGNVMCLDVLRAIDREPDTKQALFEELGRARGADRRFDGALAEFERRLGSLDRREASARWIVETLAVLLQASLLIRHSTAAVADAFSASRLGGDGRATFGALPEYVDIDSILARADH
jgi:putative acyl-CoA dehydrogenase